MIANTFPKVFSNDHLSFILTVEINITSVFKVWNILLLSLKTVKSYRFSFSFFFYFHNSIPGPGPNVIKVK